MATCSGGKAGGIMLERSRPKGKTKGPRWCLTKRAQAHRGQTGVVQGPHRGRCAYSIARHASGSAGENTMSFKRRLTSARVGLHGRGRRPGAQASLAAGGAQLLLPLLWSRRCRWLPPSPPRACGPPMPRSPAFRAHQGYDSRHQSIGQVQQREGRRLEGLGRARARAGRHSGRPAPSGTATARTGLTGCRARLLGQPQRVHSERWTKPVVQGGGGQPNVFTAGNGTKALVQGLLKRASDGRRRRSRRISGRKCMGMAGHRIIQCFSIPPRPWVGVPLAHPRSAATWRHLALLL